MGLASTLLPPIAPAPADGAAIARLRGRLRAAFGRGHGGRRSAIDTLVMGLAGVDRRGGEKAADALKRSFKPWERLAFASPEQVAGALRPVEPDLGRALVRAERLVAVVRRLIGRSGGLSLDFLAEKRSEEALNWVREVLCIPEPLAIAVLSAAPIRHRLIHLREAGLRALGRWLGAPPGSDLPEHLQTAAPLDWTGDDLFELSALLDALGEAVCHVSKPDCMACPLAKECQGVTSEQNKNKHQGLTAFLRRRIRRLEGGQAEMAFGGLRLGGKAFSEEILPLGLTPGVHQATPISASHAAAPFVLVAATLAAACDAKPFARQAGKGRGSSSPAGLRLLMVQETDAVAEQGELFGPGLQGLGLDPSSVAFVRVGSGAEAMRVIDEALKLRAAPVMAAELRRGEGAADLVASRRLGLSARRAGVWLWLITPDLSNTSAALTRWRVGAAPSAPAGRRRLGAPAFTLELTRNRQGPTGAWTLEWDVHEQVFRDRRNLARPADTPGWRAVPAPAVRAPVDRPAVVAADRLAAA